jgi:hypothetical protein
MLEMETVKRFCFEILGDFVDPENDILIEKVRNEFRVIVLRTRGIPKEIIRDEWNTNIVGSALESEPVSLYL